MKDKKVLRSFTMISQIGISMMVPIFLCGVIGRWLTRLTDNELCFVGLLLVGIGAAFRNFYLVTKLPRKYNFLALERGLSNDC